MLAALNLAYALAERAGARREALAGRRRHDAATVDIDAPRLRASIMTLSARTDNCSVHAPVRHCAG